MSCLFWNCQGLGRPLSIHEIGDLLRRYDPMLVFLSETKATQQCIDRLKRKWNYYGLAVDRVGKAGGSAMLWKKEIVVDLLSFYLNHIDVKVENPLMDRKWRCTGFYGILEQSRRHISWDLITELHGQSDLPWIIGGDFNDILTLDNCQLSDIGFEGYPYTWSNRREDPHTIRSRLDRVCANEEWNNIFPLASVQHLHCSGSDHLPILLLLKRPTAPPRRRRNRPFWFESMWTGWDNHSESDPMEVLMSKTRECRAALVRWSKSTNWQLLG
ncbi:hypothetical protein ABFS83_09G047600 [Erythranthe nasuta]